MKLRFIIMTGLIGLGMTSVQAQDYKVAKSSGTLDIREVNHVTIEGYDGNEIVFSSRNEDRERDDRSKGLRAISNSGLEDNTGVGLSVLDKGTTIEVRQLKKMDGPEIKIMVPKGVTVMYTHTSPYGDDVKVKNVEGEINISTVHNAVYLENVTGVVNVKTVHGDTQASFAAQPKNTVTISSAHGDVDVAIPVSSKDNLKLKTSRGEIFLDPDFKIEIDHTGGMVKYSDGVTGKINGGGLEIALSSTHGNIYLRKK